MREQDSLILANVPYILALLGLSFLVTLVANKYGQGLNHVKGPWWWASSDIFRLFDAWGWRPDITLIDLHEQYGKFVRIGPRAVSISDPGAIKTVYGFNNSFIKSDYYTVLRQVAHGRILPSLVNITDTKFHAKLRRSVSNAFAMSTLIQFEPLVDATSEVFLNEISTRFVDLPDDEGICDFGAWLQYFAFDVIGELTFSKRLGFLEKGEDIENAIASIEKVQDYVALTGQMPIWDWICRKNPLFLWFSKVGIFKHKESPIVAFARARMVEHEKMKVKDTKPAKGPLRRDFLSRFEEAHEKDPEFIHRQRVLALTVGNVLGGSDTTSITLQSIFYFLLKNPGKLEILQQELDQMEGEGKFSHEYLVKWDEVREWPYLTAAIKEAMRCHAATGVPLERVVPHGGATICGTFFPAGTVVGCSAWVIHRDRATYGDDVDAFRPERWLEGTEDTKAAMNNALLTFGAGARSCLGKNISYLEMYKIVPEILRRFKLSLAYPQREWQVHNAFLVKQKGFYVRFNTRRKTMAKSEN